MKRLLQIIVIMMVLCSASYAQNMTPQPQTVLKTTQAIYVDCNRTDTYTANGSIQYPYKSLDAVVAINPTSAIAIYMSPGTYTETSDVTFPNVPITIYGNGSSLIATGHTITIPNPYYTRYNLWTTAASVTFNNFTTGARCLIQGGGIIGNINVNSYCEFSQCQLTGGTVTVGTTGQALVTLCSPTDKFVSTGWLTLSKVNINTSYAGYLITSTAGQLIATDCLIYNTNTGVGGDISCSDGATTLPNFVANDVLSTAGTGYCLYSGTAYTVYSKNYVVGTNTVLGTALLPVSSDITGPGNIMALGSDATGDMYYCNSSHLLTRLGGGASGTMLTFNGTIPAYSRTLTASGTGIVPLTLKGYSTGQTSHLLDVANSAGVNLFSVDPSGHLLSNGVAPTVSAYSGVSSAAGLNSATTNTDSSGSLYFTTSANVSGLTRKEVCTVTFANAYAYIPSVVITGQEDIVTNQYGWYYSVIASTTGFSVWATLQATTSWSSGNTFYINYVVR
jgi:hypothetical protein